MLKRSDPAVLTALRSRIGALETGAPGAALEGVPEDSGVASLGAPGIDAALPRGGLARAALHEVIGGGSGDAPAQGFSAALAARLIEGRGPALWCLARGDLHGPGLGVFGLDPDRLIVVRARRDADVLWAMEEGLRSGAVGAVLGEARALDLTAGRRLQLAARAGGVTCLALRPGDAAYAPGAALTRWRVAAAPAPRGDGLPGPGFARWEVALLRCRGATPRHWLVEWNDETNGFAVVSVLAGRAAGAGAPAAQRLAG